MDQMVFNISLSILIKSLLNRKALGLNSILNEVFKVVVLVIIKDLIKVVNYYFVNRIILKYFKEFIAVALRKKGKNFFLSSYRLITLKNMLVKVLEKYIVNIMSKAAEEYKLFL